MTFTVVELSCTADSCRFVMKTDTDRHTSQRAPDGTLIGDTVETHATMTATSRLQGAELLVEMRTVSETTTTLNVPGGGASTDRGDLTVSGVLQRR